MRTLKIHKGGRYFMWSDGAPFYYLADTAWSIAKKLSRGEVDHYFAARAAQGFNAVQISALAEGDGIRTPNANGHYPFCRADGGWSPEKPDESDPKNNYWTHLDYIVRRAARHKMIVALLPTWGDKFHPFEGDDPAAFNPQNAYVYAKWLALRYAQTENIIWVLGGDRPLETDWHRAVIDEMARGLRDGDGGAHLITFHPSGAASSVQFVANRQYIDFHTIQSGHGMECYGSWSMIRKTLLAEEKPCMDLECRYEDFPACFRTDMGYCWDADDIRQNVYWNMMEGAPGHAYGHRSVWCFHTETNGDWPCSWQQALQRPGAGQMRHAMELRLSRPYFEFRSAPELVKGSGGGMGRQCAGRGEKYAYFYSPLGLALHTDLTSLKGSAIHAAWFNPRNGESVAFSCVTNLEEIFVPPTSGKGQDWLLLLDIID